MKLYPYTDTNRLLKPHTYMYAPYSGESFLKAYIANRLGHMERFFKLQSVKKAKVDRQDVEALSMLQYKLTIKNIHPVIQSVSEFLSTLSVCSFQDDGIPFLPLVDFDLNRCIRTAEILSCLLNSFIKTFYVNQNLCNLWLDRLIQRFEVTKRLYESYGMGFRKGTGVYDDITLYWKFAILLVIAYHRTFRIRYLSTLLKLNDLLLSLPPEETTNSIPGAFLSLLAGIELSFIVEMALEKGVKLHVE